MKRIDRMDKYLQYHFFSISYSNEPEYENEMQKLFKYLEQHMSDFEILRKLKVKDLGESFSPVDQKTFVRNVFKWFQKSVRIPYQAIKNQSLDIFGLKINYQENIEQAQTQVLNVIFYELSEQVILNYFLKWQNMILPIFSRELSWNQQNEYKQYLDVDLNFKFGDKFLPHFRFRFFGVFPFNVEKITLQQNDTSLLKVSVNFSYDFFKCYTFYYPNLDEILNQNQQNFGQLAFEIIEITDLKKQEKQM